MRPNSKVYPGVDVFEGYGKDGLPKFACVAVFDFNDGGHKAVVAMVYFAEDTALDALAKLKAEHGVGQTYFVMPLQTFSDFLELWRKS